MTTWWIVTTLILFKQQAFGMDDTICQQLRSGEREVGIYGTGQGKYWLYDSEQWSGYTKPVDLENTDDYQMEPPFRMTLDERVQSSQMANEFAGWPIEEQPLGNITNSYLIANAREMVIQFDNNVEWIITLKKKNKEARKLVTSTKLANIFVLGAWTDRYTWGITRNETGRGCLVGIEFTVNEFEVADVHSLHRCVEKVDNDIQRGWFCTLTGILTLFFKNGSVSFFDTGELGIQYLETKSVKDFFICSSGFKTKFMIFILLGILLLVIIGAAAIFYFLYWKKQHKKQTKKRDKKTGLKNGQKNGQTSTTSRGIRSEGGASLTANSSSNALKTSKISACNTSIKMTSSQTKSIVTKSKSKARKPKSKTKA